MPLAGRSDDDKDTFAGVTFPWRRIWFQALDETICPVLNCKSPVECRNGNDKHTRVVSTREANAQRMSFLGSSSSSAVLSLGAVLRTGK